MTALRRTLAVSAALGLALAPSAAWAHDGGVQPGAVSAAVAALPTVSSPNIKKIAGIPETAAISMEFARTGPFAYVSSLDTLSVLDLRNPKAPVLRDTFVNALFENEAMTYGERRSKDGKLTRFIIAGIDLYQVSPEDPEHYNVDDGAEIAIFDVTDPDNIKPRGRVKATSSTHTVQCVSQANCRFAYSAGDDAEFSILDLTNLDAPKELKKVPSSAAGAAGDNSPFGDDGDGEPDDGAGHYWDFDGKLGWHTGSGGAQAFNVSDPRNPVPVTGTNGKARTSPYNDFILHNSMRPNAAAFRPGAPASIKNGNVLLVTEEDYVNDGDEVECTRTGSFQSWYVPDLDGAAYRKRNTTGAIPDQGTVRPLDLINPAAQGGGGLTLPVAAFCSAHWFDVHQSGIVALGSYQAGLRLIDVRNPRDLKQYGYVTGGASEVWDAYWVPKRDAKGVAIRGQKTNIVYTADAVRGIEVFEVALPGSTSTSTTAVDAAAQAAPTAVTAAAPARPALPATVALLPLAALPLITRLRKRLRSS